MTDGQDLARRHELVRSVVGLDSSTADARRALARFPWDCPEELVVIRAEDFVAVLRRYLAGEFSASTVNEWADFLEVRDDVGVADDRLRQILFELANPSLTEPLHHERAQELIDTLREE